MCTSNSFSFLDAPKKLKKLKILIWILQKVAVICNSSLYLLTFILVLKGKIAQLYFKVFVKYFTWSLTINLSRINMPSYAKLAADAIAVSEMLKFTYYSCFVWICSYLLYFYYIRPLRNALVLLAKPSRLGSLPMPRMLISNNTS